MQCIPVTRDLSCFYQRGVSDRFTRDAETSHLHHAAVHVHLSSSGATPTVRSRPPKAPPTCTHFGRKTRPRLSRPLRRSFPRSADDVIARTVLVSPTSTCRRRSRFRRTLKLSLLKTCPTDERKACKLCRISNLCCAPRLLRLRVPSTKPLRCQRQHSFPAAVSYT